MVIDLCKTQNFVSSVYTSNPPELLYSKFETYRYRFVFQLASRKNRKKLIGYLQHPKNAEWKLSKVRMKIENEKN